ncbi:flippase-like domain-containing protein [Candidatus Sumerlaeota bacterium]|nr:flippase-like domain-containing protein [Candidatus Sumerlaeota bacterium]
MSGKKTLKIVLSCGLSAFFLYLAFKNVPFNHLIEVFRKRIEYGWIIPFTIITLLGMYIRAVRWRWILKSKGEYASLQLFPSLIIGFALNSFLPLRAGEFARPFIFARKQKIPYTTVLATVVVERIVDSMTLLFSFFVVLLFIRIDPKSRYAFNMMNWEYVITGETLSRLNRKLSLITLFLLLVSITFIIDSLRRIYEVAIQRIPLLGMRWKERLIHIIRQFSEGFHSLKNIRFIIMIFFYSLIIWGLVGFSLQVMSWGFPDFSMQFHHGMAVMIIICIAIMIPAAPGYWGLYECGTIFALIALGLVPSTDAGLATALGFSLIIHAFQIIPIALVGLYFLWKENISLSQIEKLAEP